MRINSNLSDSIELDKTFYEESFYNQDLNHCFQSLRSLDQASSYISVLEFGDKSATTPESKAQWFNEFFGSVFGPKVIADIMFPSLEIFHLKENSIKNADVKRRLEACDDSC